jgi:hypothetical protein
MTWLIGPMLLVIPELWDLEHSKKVRVVARFLIGFLVSAAIVNYRSGPSALICATYMPNLDDLIVLIPICEVVIRFVRRKPVLPPGPDDSTSSDN